MVYFTKREVKRVALPSNKKLWVDVYSTLTWKEEKAVGDGRVQGVAPADTLLRTMIVDWNLEDENGIAPVTPDNIDKLQRPDAIAIVNEIEGIMVAAEEATPAKKNSSETSSQR